MRQPWR